MADLTELKPKSEEEGGALKGDLSKIPKSSQDAINRAVKSFSKYLQIKFNRAKNSITYEAPEVMEDALKIVLDKYMPPDEVDAEE